MGQLAAGIAHEVNNPMGYVKSNLSSLTKYHDSFFELLNLAEKIASEKEPDKITAHQLAIASYWQDKDIGFLIADTRQLLAETQSGIYRVIEIVSGLKSFSRASDEKMEDISVNQCLQEAKKLAHNALKYKARILEDLQELPVIKGNMGELIQVFLNLLVNAGQSIAKNGEINITTRVNDGFIEASISDNGCGIPEKNLQNIFNPFFTTKDVGEGTGLGLSISFGIIENHHGHIEVDSEEGIGTCFKVLLPLPDK